MQVDEESYICDVRHVPDEVPCHCGVIHSYEKLSETQLRITAVKGESLNRLFEVLTKQNIEVMGIKTDVNRLEKIFVDTAKKSKGI